MQKFQRLSSQNKSLYSNISLKYFSNWATFKLPPVTNEKYLHYAPGSQEREQLKQALKNARSECPEVPCIVGGEEIYTGDIQKQLIPSDHHNTLCTYHKATPEIIKKAIEASQSAKQKWELMPSEDRLAIFTKAAWLLSKKHRYDVLAATMLGTSKNIWQAEIDAGWEMIDFWRFGCKYVEDMYKQQPEIHDDGVWNRVEYRALEGFITAITPFNFAAIGGNLPSIPAMVGNTVLWKPSSTAILSNYRLFQILQEAGLPAGVINFIPSSGSAIEEHALRDPRLAGVHFTGSTEVFRTIWSTIGNNIHKYKTYPRIVGETGGKNFHFIHPSADIDHVVNNTLRGAFEYQGQKCSACSRMYIPKSLWNDIKEKLVSETLKIKLGQPDEFEVFMCAVIDKSSYKNIKSYIDYAKNDNNSSILVGGHCDDNKGYFISPTIIQTSDPFMKCIKEEIFGPVLTCYVYDDNKLDETLDLCDQTTDYALTGSIFAQDRDAIIKMSNKLRHSAGNFYINDKSTGAIVAQQPFGGGRASGTNDKAGSSSIFYRFVSMRSIKENFLPLKTWKYPSMMN